MRYLDWDVLLFPHGSHVPVAEFRTSCYGVDSDVGRTPTMNSFISSLPQQSSFQISIHRWTKPAFSAGLAILSPGGSDPDLAVWGIRVMVDGYVVSSETLSPDSTWPQLIGDSQVEKSRLHFPAFHREILHRSHIHVAEDLGRVKIFISEGTNFTEGDKVRFRPMAHIACFTFVHAPLAILEQLNIAWPNQTICGNGNLVQRVYAPPQPPSLSKSTAMTNAAFQFCSPISGMAAPNDGCFFPPSMSMAPPPRPSYSFGNMCGPDSEAYSLSSRSMPYNDLATGFQYVPSPYSFPRQQPRTRRGSGHYHTRHPSDQARQAIESLSIQQSPHSTRSDVSVAPVEPLNSTEKDKVNASTYGSTSTRSASQRSSASDVSMHIYCNQFPICIVDDPKNNGCTIHSPVPDIQVHIPRDNPHSHSSPLPRRPPTAENDMKLVGRPSSPKSMKRNCNVFGGLETDLALEKPPRKVSKTDSTDPGPESRLASLESGSSII